MAVYILRNRRPPRMHPGCADPLLKRVYMQYVPKNCGEVVAGLK
jgi:hypothetical protein